jgi:hypothetical protein
MHDEEGWERIARGHASDQPMSEVFYRHRRVVVACGGIR